jgi:hypothetical protein
MKMDMYWPQQEVFLMGTLSLFPERLTKGAITLDYEWYFFNSKTDDELVQQLYKYKKAGYIEFKEVPLLVVYADKDPDPDDESNFRLSPRGFLITSVNTQKVTDDLNQYLENWCNDKLLTDAAHKPDDYKYQHEKLLSALKRTYRVQSMPRIKGSDIYGDPVSNFYSYQPPFWEVMLAPHFVNKQYVIRQMDYDLVNGGQPFVDIKIIDEDLKHSLEKTQSIKPTAIEWAELKVEGNTVHIRLESGGRYRLKRFRTDNAPLNFINYMLAHPDTEIKRAVIQTTVEGCAQKANMTELVRQCGFTAALLPLKEAFFAGTTEQKVHFTSRVSLTNAQINLIKTNLTTSD